MIVLREGAFDHSFPEGWTASKYDEWPFYRDHLTKAFGAGKAVDIVASDGRGNLWLVEIKDYREHSRTKPSGLAEEVAHKVRDSLVGLLLAAKWHSGHTHLEEARLHLGASKVRVVLHLEQPKASSKLFSPAIDPASIQSKLKQLVRVVDAHPLMVDASSERRVPWTIAAV